MQAALTALADGATVVTANNRLARSIALTYNRAQKAAGKGAWLSPDVLPWGAWIERLWDVAAMRAGPDAAYRTLLGDRQSRLILQRIIEGMRPDTAWATAGAMADMAQRAWQLCHAWQVDVGSLPEMADSDDSALFAACAAEYSRQCRDRRWTDSAMLPGLLIRELAGRAGLAPSRLLLAGFDEPTPQQRHCIDQLQHAGTQATWLPIPQQPRGSLWQVRCADRSEELDCAARWARAFREEQSDALVAVVVPDLDTRAAEVRRAFLDVLAPDWRIDGDGQQNVNLSLGAPLAGVPVIHVALLALGALRGSLDYRELGQLLRTPYLVAAAQESRGRAELDLVLREQIGTTIDLRVAIARGRELAPQFARRLAALRERCESWPARQSAAQWVDAFCAALAEIGWPGDRGLDAQEYQAIRAWQHVLDEFARADQVLGPLTVAAALSVLGGMARDQVFQPEGRSDAIQVMGALEAVGQEFDGLWVCGLTSDAWPPAGRPSPLLPLGLQRRLRMPNSAPALIREHSERLLRHLIGSARQVIVSWPEAQDDEVLTPSALVQRVPERAFVEVQRWPEESYRQRLAAQRRLETLDPDPAPPVAAGRPVRGGTRLLSQQARCPARAFAEMRLGASELPVPAPGIAPALRGQIVHAVLERFFAEVTDQAALLRLSPDDANRRLLAAIDAELRQRLPLDRALIRRMADIEARRIVAIGTQFLAGERSRPAFRVEASEASRTTRLAGLELRLRPDRIDRLGDGGRLVIDYKTGTDFKPSGWRGARLREPQLPLYAVALDAAAIAIVELKPDGTRWRSVGAAGIVLPDVEGPGEFSGGVHGDWAALCAAWRTALQSAAAEFMAGDFRVNLRDADLAAGRWAMLTRIHEQPAAAMEEDE